jgi:hypothetical protein
MPTSLPFPSGIRLRSAQLHDQAVLGRLNVLEIQSREFGVVEAAGEAEKK